MKKLNKKGFTLIELLAVIVVLAVVMLIAVTAVVPMMNRSRKQSFITEATTILNGAESYFMYHEMTSGELKCVNVNAADAAAAGSYGDLIGEYVEEKGKDSYKGVVLKDSSDNYDIYLTNGNGYYLVTDDDNISTLDDTAVEESEPATFYNSCADVPAGLK